MNTRFDVGDKAYVEVTIFGISINEDGVRYLVRADKDTFITTNEHLMNLPEGITKDWENLNVICDNCGHTIHVRRLANE